MQRSKKPSPLLFSEPATSSEFGLDCQYSSLPVEHLLTSEKVLAVISSGTSADLDCDPRHVHSGLTALSQPALSEVWSTSGAVVSGADKALCWSQCDETLFAVHRIDSSDYPDQQEAIYQAYTTLLSFIGGRGYSDIVRVWNYMPHINHGEDDAESYRQFCLGRQKAFADSTYDENTFPSACALGHDGDRTIIYLLAGKRPVIHIENPLQESAYNYPRKYGPASPSFARASLAKWRDTHHLYISGTASILGCRSHHPNNLAGQLQTTFDNIDSLLQHSADQADLGECPQMGLLKIYIRNPADFLCIEERVRLRFPSTPVQYLQADICRRELLVEIDGLCFLGSSIAATQLAENRGG